MGTRPRLPTEQTAKRSTGRVEPRRTSPSAQLGELVLGPFPGGPFCRELAASCGEVALRVEHVVMQAAERLLGVTQAGGKVVVDHGAPQGTFGKRRRRAACAPASSRLVMPIIDPPWRRYRSSGSGTKVPRRPLAAIASQKA